jgi:Cu+-exporting ATPase
MEKQWTESQVNTNNESRPQTPEPARDPVCGMTVDPGTELRHVHQQVEYLFCCNSCRGKFMADPDLYLNPGPDAEDTTGASQYTCPMHPEIISDQPGDCPICGMALDPVLPTLDDDSGNSELQDMSRRFWISMIFAVPLLLVSMGDMLPGAPISQILSESGRIWLELLLATPICVWAARPFYNRALSSLKTRTGRKRHVYLQHCGCRNTWYFSECIPY